jgi:hypothetical protein
MEFFNLVADPGATQHRAAQHTGTHAADRQTVGLHSRIRVVGCPQSAAAGHILVDDLRVPRNMLLEKFGNRLGALVPRAAGLAALHHGDDLSLIERRLGKTGGNAKHQGADKDNYGS